jgi:tetratricopeptide (TPR) repeat protein
MGFCYINMDRRDQAIQEFREAARLQPGYVTAWNNLADALEKASRWKEALEAYESAYELEPENPTAKAAVERLRTRARRMTTTM